MNFDDLSRIWQTPGNQPGDDSFEVEKRRFVAALRRRHTGFVALMTFVFAALTFITVVSLAQTIGRESGSRMLDLSQEWSLLLFLFIPWLAWAYSVGRYFSHRRRHPVFELSIQSSLRALLDANRLASRRSLVIGGSQLALLLALPLVIAQLKSAGKAGAEIDAMYWLASIVFGAVMIALFIRYRTRLLPERRRLEQLLSEYTLGDDEAVLD